jgi:uncharacterized membrane protein YgdD (TMEM256/DUF423 family)
MAIGAIFGFFAVLIGAFGAHALKGSLTEYGAAVFHTAWEYHALHAIVLLVLPLLPLGEENIKVLAWVFALGIIIFSGSLYALAITETKWLGAITPIGGVLFLVGWAFLAWKLFRLK